MAQKIHKKCKRCTHSSTVGSQNTTKISYNFAVKVTTNTCHRHVFIKPTSSHKLQRSVNVYSHHGHTSVH